MESIVSYFSTIGLDLPALLKLGAILLISALLLYGISRFIFRKQTLFASAISSSIAIVFIYVLMVLIIILATDLKFLVTPLPFVSLSENTIQFFQFKSASYAVIAAHVLRMIFLAFLVSIVDAILPAGKRFISWVFWRVVTVALGFVLHYLLNGLIAKYLPQGIVLYAPAILLAILILMLLTGSLRFLVGILLTTVNPLIAALYTFFFATIAGKQITKSVLTAGLLSGVMILLEKLDIQELSLLPSASVAYIPFLLLLIPVWYFIHRE